MFASRRFSKKEFNNDDGKKVKYLARLWLPQKWFVIRHYYFLKPFFCTQTPLHVRVCVCVYLYLKWCFLRPRCRWLLETKWSWTQWTLGSRSTPARTSLWIIQAATRCVWSAEKIVLAAQMLLWGVSCVESNYYGFIFSSRPSVYLLTAELMSNTAGLFPFPLFLARSESRQRLTSRLEIHLNRIKFVAARET